MNVLRRHLAPFFHRFLPDKLPPWEQLAAVLLVTTGVAVAGYGLWQVRQTALSRTWQTIPADGPDGQTLANDSADASVNSDVSRKSDQDQPATSQLGTVFMDVAGAVEHPGLYQLRSGDRVAQALLAAGGVSDQADGQYVARQLNLAAAVKDGQKLYVPFAGETAGDESAQAGQSYSSNIASQQSGTAQQSDVSQQTGTSINTATLSELQELPGIGEKRSQDIVAGRPYQQLDDLVDRDVLTSGVFENIEALISL